jgi:hypothetical protein
MTNNPANPLQGWIPYRANISATGIDCHWLDTFNAAYTEPFFDETIVKLKGIPRRANHYKSVSSLPMMEEWSGNIKSYIEPTAIIFHISRCGSTLISQLLSISQQNIVLPEVPFFDDLLRLPYKNQDVSATDTQRMLKAALKFYGQKRTGNERQLYIKADSWHIFFYKQLRELYPQTPFILLYRKPGEVFESHTKQRGMHAVPGLIEAELFGLDRDTASQMSLDIYLARVLEQYFTAYIAVSTHDKNTLLVNYDEGTMPIMDKIAAFIQISFDGPHYEGMKERANYHSKHPGKVFSEKGSNTAPAFLQNTVSLYQQLEQIRLAMLIRAKAL